MKLSHITKTTSAEHGFTYVEAMFALAIFTLVVGVVMSPGSYHSPTKGMLETIVDFFSCSFVGCKGIKD